MSVSFEEREKWDSFYKMNAPDQLPWETGRAEPDLAELIKQGVVEEGRVLDICCGLGTQSIYLAKKGFEVYGIDISSTAVKMAQERCSEEGVACHLTQGDASDLKYPDGFFTFVFDRGCFHSMNPERREKYIRGIRRVLKDDGKYYLKCFSSRNGSWVNSFTEKEIRNYFSPLFKIIAINEYTHVENTYGQRVYLYGVLMQTR
ncbi:MAG: class I SAM-dependent methyltransferase [Thaumarchaeota archaeon]|nr:class I SAM-dependent methyltransferase [Nitrososphaerota archaeon]MCL5316875.1 class I SAM-dependent methyltransferase [Nitrososphaerota archaeon]